MVCLLVVGFVANLLVRPVDPKHHVENEEPQTGQADGQGSGGGASGAPTVEPAGKTVVPIPVAWIVVGVPILYGLTYTFINGIQLFTH